jgi:hypothetical protein
VFHLASNYEFCELSEFRLASSPFLCWKNAHSYYSPFPDKGNRAAMELHSTGLRLVQIKLFVQVQRTEPSDSVSSVQRHHHELLITSINRLQVLHQVKSRAVDTSSAIHVLEHRHRFVVCPSRVGRLPLLTACSDAGLSFQLDTSFLVKASVCSGNIQPQATSLSSCSG